MESSSSLPICPHSLPISSVSFDPSYFSATYTPSSSISPICFSWASSATSWCFVFIRHYLHFLLFTFRLIIPHDQLVCIAVVLIIFHVIRGKVGVMTHLVAGVEHNTGNAASVGAWEDMCGLCKLQNPNMTSPSASSFLLFQVYLLYHLVLLYCHYLLWGCTWSGVPYSSSMWTNYGSPIIRTPHSTTWGTWLSWMSVSHGDLSWVCCTRISSGR